MSRNGVVVWSLTSDVHLFIRTPDIDTGWSLGRKVSRGMGFRTPHQITAIVLDRTPETDEVTTSIVEGWTHKEVTHWVLRNEHADDFGSVGNVLHVTPEP